MQAIFLEQPEGSYEFGGVDALGGYKNLQSFSEEEQWRALVLLSNRLLDGIDARQSYSAELAELVLGQDDIFAGIKRRAREVKQVALGRFERDLNILISIASLTERKEMAIFAESRRKLALSERAQDAVIAELIEDLFSGWRELDSGAPETGKTLLWKAHIVENLEMPMLTALVEERYSLSMRRLVKQRCSPQEFCAQLIALNSAAWMMTTLARLQRMHQDFENSWETS